MDDIETCMQTVLRDRYVYALPNPFRRLTTLSTVGFETLNMPSRESASSGAGRQCSAVSHDVLPICSWHP